MAKKPATQSPRYDVRWLKVDDQEWRTLKQTDSLIEARAWRDQWRKSSTCQDIMIFDTVIDGVTS